MPTIHPRVNVVLEKPLYNFVLKIAKKEGVSLSLKVRDFVRQAVEEYEDSRFSELASDRAATFRPDKALSHEKVWAHLEKPAKK